MQNLRRAVFATIGIGILLLATGYLIYRNWEDIYDLILHIGGYVPLDRINSMFRRFVIRQTQNIDDPRLLVEILYKIIDMPNLPPAPAA